MKLSQPHMEVEVKFYIAQPDVVRRQLSNLDTTVQPKVFETNIRFEDNAHSLKANNKLLRLRHDDNGCRLTYKCKPPMIKSQCKVYQEFEVSVGEFETMQTILLELGYHATQIYEKWRQCFHWRNVEVCLDTMPYGTFLEIEGPEEDIKQAARNLHLAWEKRILTNYLAIFEVLRERYQLPFNDLTFDNFKSHPVDISPLLKSLEAG